MRSRLQRSLFRLLLLVKTLDGILEVIGGVLLWSVTPLTVSRLTVALTQHELAEDPRDFVANHLVAAARHLTNDVRLFAVVYLLVHGVIKTALMIAVLKGHKKVYPCAIGFLGLFICYQVYRVGYSGSGGLAVITAIDIVVVILIWREYRYRERESLPRAASSD